VPGPVGCIVAEASGGVGAAREKLVRPDAVTSSVKVTFVIGALASTMSGTEPA